MGKTKDAAPILDAKEKDDRVARWYEAKLQKEITDLKTAAEPLILALQTPAIVRTKRHASSVKRSLSTYKVGPDSKDMKKRMERGDFEMFGATYNNTLSRLVNSKDPSDNLKILLEDCIPCLDRITALAQLNPLQDLLDLLEKDLQTRFDYADAFFNLASNGEIYDDLCNLLNFLNFNCIPDLAAMLASLRVLLFDLMDSLRANINISFAGLVLPIFGPFMVGLKALLDKYLQLILAPIECIIANIMFQMTKIPDLEKELDLMKQITQIRKVDLGITSQNTFGTGDKDKKKNTLVDVLSFRTFSDLGGLKDLGPRNTEAKFLDDIKGIGQKSSLLGGFKAKTDFNDGQVAATDTRFSRTNADIYNPRSVVRGAKKVEKKGEEIKKGVSSIYGFLTSYLLRSRDYVQGIIFQIRDQLDKFLEIEGEKITTGITISADIMRITRLIAIMQQFISLVEGKGSGCDNPPSNQDILRFNKRVQDVSDIKFEEIDGRLAIMSPDDFTNIITRGPITTAVTDEGQQERVKANVFIKPCLSLANPSDVEKAQKFIEQLREA